MNKDQYAANVLYLEDVKEEKKDRESGLEKKDYHLIDNLIMDINQLGYSFKFEADLRWREIKDRRIIPILERYLLQFENIDRAEDLVGIVGHEGFNEATPLVINLYQKIKKQGQKFQCAGCDNALYNIKDKGYIGKYLEFAKNEEDVMRLPLTMTMLAKWNIPELKEYFLNYINSQNRDLKFISIECLSYFNNDIMVLESLKKSLDTVDKDIIKAIKKAIKKLKSSESK